MTPDYKKLWETCVLDDGVVDNFKIYFNTIYLNQNRYKKVTILTSVPWKLIAALHFRESSLSFRGCLHNGDPLYRPTTHVPKGRGPFASWEESAVDALMMDKEHFPVEWTVPNQLHFAEKFNGYGYRRTSELSPYVWAYTNHHDETGKYVADGRYSATAIEKQLGVAAIIKGIDELMRAT